MMSGVRATGDRSEVPYLSGLGRRRARVLSSGCDPFSSSVPAGRSRSAQLVRRKANHRIVETGIRRNMIAEPDLIGDEPCCVVESSCANGPARDLVLLINDPPEQRRPASRAEPVGNVRVVRRAEPRDRVDGLNRDVLLQRPRRRHEVPGELLATGAMALTHTPKRPHHRVPGSSTQTAAVGDFMTHAFHCRATATVASGDGAATNFPHGHRTRAESARQRPAQPLGSESEGRSTFGQSVVLTE